MSPNVLFGSTNTPKSKDLRKVLNDLSKMLQIIFLGWSPFFVVQVNHNVTIVLKREIGKARVQSVTYCLNVRPIPSVFFQPIPLSIARP